MSAEDFKNRYDLTGLETFVANYLPQFAHLKDAFAYFCIVCLDNDSVRGLPIKSFPPFSGTRTAHCQFLLNWIHANSPSDIKRGSYGIYDPTLGARISYREHSVYIDKLLDYSTIGNRASCMLVRLSVYSGNASNNNLKVLLPASLNPPVITEPIVGSTDISKIKGLTDVLYLPAIHLEKVQVDAHGTFQVGEDTYSGFRPFCPVKYAFIGNSLKVFDIGYKRKTFFERQRFIPSQYQVIPSSTIEWEHAYVVFPSSFCQIDTFAVSRFEYYQRLKVPKKKFSIQEKRIRGIGWNETIGAMVYDSRSSLLLTTRAFKYHRPTGFYNSNYEFQNQSELKQRYFKSDGEWYAVIDSSSDENRIPPDHICVLEVMLKSKFGNRSSLFQGAILSSMLNADSYL
jgi:hypothetical protein